MKMASEALYCICKQQYDPSRFMIECDLCKDWFHGNCVGVREDQSVDVEEYHCPGCTISYGPLVLKKRSNYHRHDYTEDYDPESAVQAGTLVFIKNLKSRFFRDADEIIQTPSGQDLSERYLEKKGFKVPILVENKEGLGLLVPPPTFTVSDVEQYVGSMLEIDVIDVARQEECKMLMREWVEYYNSPNRDKALNVISLEFSNTSLSNLVQAPAIVRKISWVENMWPDHQPENVIYAKPQVSKYCLMGVKNSYTDFHMDFGGTSVWYHVLRGEKIFYVIKPTEQNLKLYEEWASSPKQSEIFFGSKVDACYKCVVKQGQTLFIPTGWIHAVLTSVDSLVFGGNFLHSFNSGLQIRVYDIEKRLKTPQRFQFPWFETTIWFASKHLLQKVKEAKQEEPSKATNYLLDSIKTVVDTLKSWTSRRELRHHIAEIPESIDYTKIIRDLNKEVKALEKLMAKKKGKKKGRKKGNNDDSSQEYEIQPVKVEPKVKSKTLTHHMPAQILSPSLKNNSYRAEAQSKSVKFKLPKGGISTDSTMTSGSEDENARSMLSDAAANRLKLVLSNGKIISKSGVPVVTSRGGFQSLTSGGIQSEAMMEDDIVVDDVIEGSKMKTAAEMLAGSTAGALKLKLSFNGKSSHQSPTSSNKFNQDSSQMSTSNTSGFDSDDDVMPSDRSPSHPSLSSVDALLQASKMDSAAPLPHISVADIEAELKQQPASPGTQDAIQGMLAIAQPQKVKSKISSLTEGKSDEENISEEEGGRPKRIRKRKYLDDYDGEEMRNCFQDAKYVYPTLDDDDDSDGPVFKSRNKYTKRDPGDMPWNPKAKVVMPVPKMNRPHREGVRKAHVEEGLADAKARLANKPPAKRQYVRRKPLPKKPSIEDMPSTSSLAHSLGPYDFKSQLSTSLSQSAPASVLSAMKQEGPGRPRKPKKGMATAKQRLSKILKIQKGGRLLV